MRTVFREVGAAAIILCALTLNAQNTPAPCDPANVQYTYTQEGCWNTPDCSTGYQCLDLRVGYDNFYGTTCSVDYVAICSQPGFPNEAKKKEGHAKTVLAAVRARYRNRS